MGLTGEAVERGAGYFLPGLGVSPNSLIPPKIEDPPQEEWRLGGALFP